VVSGWRLAAIFRVVSGLFCGEDVFYGEYEPGVLIMKCQEAEETGWRSGYLVVVVISTQAARHFLKP
jgi:hypothetical protein